MAVTVIIVNWNSSSLLTQCLQHLSLQTVLPKQVIVVDNASFDGSAKNVESFENVILFQMTSNLGFAAGNNRALAECKDEFVALLNPDAFPESDWLENLLIAATNYPDVAAFGSRQLCQANPEFLDGIGDSYHLSGLVWRDRYGVKQQKKHLRAMEIFSPCAAAALYRRQALVDVDGFDEDYFCYVEDIDLGFRLRLAGHKARYVPNAVVHHVGSATTGGQHSDFSIYHGHRNLVWTYIKNMPGYLFWILLPLHIGLNFISIVWFVLNGHSGAILSAKWDALSGLPKMWSKRKFIQKRRVASIGVIWKHLNKSIFLD
ncbi:glycosyltransferase family 2 protein [Solimicrobium silvestre]|uniref:Putative glycosyltransferase n=1 Tax=Solimicrobium silvestre TaxID=2099400 RepID=A0A2S9H0N1_9BURK|nr:glycosyltransferase family 2 protein [Solimicrobium silvestre]PRC93544.1 putative glycosyltransferase [Solimicrobium silvestre]